MILYVNGDSHSAGAEIANSYAFAEDDPLYWALGRQAHPDNLKLSYGCELANMLGAILHCDAESASSNDRIIRTIWAQLQGVQGLPVARPDLIIIGWSTWEREEWLHEGTYYQVTASGTDDVPPELSSKYKKWVIGQDHITREARMLHWHDRIYRLHKDLSQNEIPHLFFNTYSDFSAIRSKRITTHNRTTIPEEQDWGGCYIDPYNPDLTYYNWCIQNGFKTVNPNSYHFGHDAHCAWAEFLYQTYVQKLLTQ